MIVDWDTYQSGKRSGLLLGYIKGLKIGIVTLAEVQFGTPDATFLEEIEHIIDPACLEGMLQCLKTAASIAEVRALYLPALKNDNAAPPPQH